ncbi:MAG: EAL domain-containing protein [Methylococcales bacterium]|nr:EAL domain-containing protein [Methylococcales bacterium]
MLLSSSTVLSENSYTQSNRTVLEKVRVQLKWFHQFRFAGYYAALEQGYYADEGLDVELLERQLNKSVVDQVINGNAVYGVGDSSLLHELAIGKPVVGVAAIFQHNPLVFMSLGDSGIVTPEGIRGKKVVYDANNVLEAPLKALLTKAKVTESDIILNKQADDYRLFLAKRVDVIAGYLTSQLFYYEQAGIKINVLNPQDYGIDFYGDMLFTSAAERQKNPERIERFLRATLKGWRYALDNSESIINLIAKRYHSKLSIEQLRFEAESIRLLIDNKVQLGKFDPARLKELADLYAQLGYNHQLTPEVLKEFVFVPNTSSQQADQSKKVSYVSGSENSVKELVAAEHDGFVNEKINGFLSLIVIVVVVVCALYLKREIHARQIVERRELRRQTIITMVANHEPLMTILKNVVADIEQFDRAIACSVLLLNEDKKSLRHCATSRLPVDYCLELEGSTFGQDCCPSCETAFTGEPVFIDNIQSDAKWGDIKKLTGSITYKSCWSQAIFSNEGELLGSFTIYHQDSKKPSRHFLQLISDSAELVAIAIEKSNLDTQLQLSASLFTHAREGIYITDANGSIIDCNEAFLKMSGYSRAELLGKNPRIFKSGVHDKAYYAQMWKSLIEKDSWSGEIWNKYKNRDKSPGLHSITAIRNQNNVVERYLVQVTDISDLKQQQQTLEKFAYNDTLTGLPNRLLLIDRLNQSLLKNQRDGNNLAIIFVDLDGFKAINDTYGHNVGDDFLVAIGQKMQAVIRESDTLARIGGDEFVVILNGLDALDSYKKPVINLLKACNSSLDINGVMLKVSASLGVRFYRGQYDKESLDGDTLLRQADQAMYVAKQSGKNQYHLFDANSDQVVSTRSEIIQAIQRGLQTGEFVLHYQPKVNMLTGELLGVEALVRWEHPDQGLLLPADFLSVIENHPLCIEMGEWVIKSALVQLNEWQVKGLNIPVSVNINARHLSQHNFLERLKSALITYPNFRSGSLELEVFESTVLADKNYAFKMISDCQKLGVTFALDHFGVGYSSLSYLRELPINTIKIDRSFIADMDKSPENYAVINSVVGLLSTLGCNIIAEGVETLEQGEVLLNMGCELAQGYGFGNPMSSDRFLVWYDYWSKQTQDSSF